MPRPWKALRRLIPTMLLAVCTSAFAGTAHYPTGKVAVPEVVLSSASEELPAQPASTSVLVFVELNQAPAVQAWASVMEQAAQSGKGGVGDRKALVARADAAGRAQKTQIAAEQSTFSAALQAHAIDAKVVYQLENALNGMAVEVEPSKIDELAHMPGVKSVRIMQPEYPTNSTSVPFLGTPQVWENSLGLPAGYDGTGVRIGIIDSGIDYQHASFGGTGLLTDYQANDRTVAPDTYFPNAKVVGGYDFAGDAYTGSNAAVPDADPMDCGGHGSHVAGTAAGYGVKADGTTYNGPYTSGADYAGLRIGPGTAPKAQLYAYRVFGCTGSTGLTALAIDRSLDPNDDDDLSDHLDVINMSLGSAFGRLSDTSAAASQNASLAGMIVVASAGNSGDVYFVTGSPGAATRAVSTAATYDGGLTTLAVLVNSPAAIAGGYMAGGNSFPGSPTWPVTGEVVLGVDANEGAGFTVNDGCSALTNAAAIAGKIALIYRGGCGFQVKAKNAQNAGAIGVIVGNAPANAGDLTLSTMGVTAGEPNINIPAMFIPTLAADKLRDSVPAANVTLTLTASATDVIASFSSRGPGQLMKPDIAAPGVNITSVQTGVTCTAGSCMTPNASGYIPDSQSLVLSGTSMAAPHMAGLMALFRQMHPDWSVEELKALAMNGAAHDATIAPGGAKISVSRAGAGRVDPPRSAMLKTIAFNANGEGGVSVGFFGDAVSAGTRTQQVRVENKGDATAEWDLAVVTTKDAPGMSFSVSPTSLMLGPGESEVVDVTLTVSPSAMDHRFDADAMAGVHVVANPSALATRLIPREWITEESALLTFSGDGGEEMRVPLYASPRAASTMAAAASIPTAGAPTGTANLTLSGTAVCTNGCDSFPTEVTSLVTPFELQVVSPRDPSMPAEYDLQYAGVAADAQLIWFGVSTWGDWTVPTTFVVYIDNDSNGSWDRQITTTSTGRLAKLFGSTNPETDAFTSSVLTPPGSVSTITGGLPVNGVGPAIVDTAVFNNNVMFFGALPSQLGLANVNTPFRWKIETCPNWAPWCRSFNGFWWDEATGPYSWSGAARGIDSGNGSTLYFDNPAATVPITWNTANMTTNGSLGALLLHHHNASGSRAQVVPLDTASTADLSLSISPTSVSAPVGSQVVVHITISSGATGATGVQVAFTGSESLEYVSHVASAGTSVDVDAALWDVGALDPNSSKTLDLTLEVTGSGSHSVNAVISSASPLDSNTANNSASASIATPASADLEVTVTPGAASAHVGDAISYTVNVKNNGLDPAYSIDLTHVFDEFPSAEPSTAIASQGVFDTGTMTWNLAGLGSGMSATIVFGLSAPNMAGSLTLESTATAETSDPDTSNNAAQGAILVLSPASVTATKTLSGDTFIGGHVVYTIVLSNSSDYDQQDNTGDEFVDVLPDPLKLDGASATSGTATANLGTDTVTWNGVVPAHGTVTITINATIGWGQVGTTISNQGTVNYDADGNGTNEASAVTDDPGAAGSGNATAFALLGHNIPTLSSAALLALASLLAGLAYLALKRA